MIARTGELSAIERFVAASAERPAVLLLEGEPGIGKTTLWEAALDAARDRRLRILSARASGAEAQLSFAALTDLLEDVEEDAFALLPAPQRPALDVALLREVPAGAAPEPRAIALGFLNVLRALASRGPLVLAVDDIQWLDSASAEALAFAARRLDGEPISFLLARRPGTPSDLERVLERREPIRLHVGPLGLTATGRLLLERLGLNIRRQLLRRIVDATRGNPLFALELGRTLAEQGPPATGEEMPVPDVVEDLLGTRVSRLADPVRRLLLAVALSGDLRASQLSAIGDATAVDEAVEAGVLALDRDHARPSHPLLAAAAIQRSTVEERRQLHAQLAGVVADDELRAFHLALATEEPDEELASSVADAARGAAARGAAQEAVVLAEHALRLTAEPEERIGRLLALGEYLSVAGEQVRLTELLKSQVEALPPGEARVKACLLLSNGAVENNDEIVHYLERALAESGRDAGLRAGVLAEISTNSALARVERIREAEERALEAVETARGAGPAVERSALYALAWARILRGHAIDDVCVRFAEISDAGAYLAFSPERVAGQRLAWRGDVGEARPELVRLLTLSDQRGEPISYALQRMHLCELELRAGGWDEAGRLLDEWERDGELLLWPCYDRCRALLAAGRGLADDTQQWASETVTRGLRTGLNWDVVEALRARGIGALLAGDLTLAEDSLAAVWERTEREGVEDPGVFPVAPDLAIDVGNLAGTPLGTVDADLAAFGGGGDAQIDNVLVRGTDGVDSPTVGGSAGSIAFGGLAALVRVAGGEAHDEITLSTFGGGDTIAAGMEIPGSAPVNVNGGDAADVLRYNGTAAGDQIDVVANGTEVSTLGAGASRVDATAVESLVALGHGGADTITGTGNLAALIALTFEGGEDGDVLRGGNGPDVLLGGNGNDALDGNQGADQALAGDGDDRFQWDPGDGSDTTVDGEAGNDLLDFFGSGANENIAVAANGQLARLTRNVAAIVLDLDGVEHLAVHALAGTDAIDVGNLAGTDVGTVDVGLGAFGGGPDGMADSVVVNGTDSADMVEVTRSGSEALADGLAALVRIAGGEAANDTLRIQTGDGNDDVVVAPDVSELIATIVDLGGGE